LADQTGFAPPRGMRDIESGEMVRRHWMYEKIQQTMLLYGFQMVEPTAIETLSTLEAKSGPEIKNEIYWFEDKAGRKLGLRFDLTVGMTRMVANRLELPEPVKFCAISEMWRYDEPQFARYRHFSQWDAEIYGSSEQEADAEVICLGMNILDNLGLKDYEVRISNRKLTEGFLRSKGIESREKIEATIRVIDKIRKMSREQIIEEFRTIELDVTTIEQILSFASLRGKPDQILSESSELLGKAAGEGFEELSRLAEIIHGFQRIDRCVYDLSIVRGIGYYDGTVFEAYDSGSEDIGAIFAGGRYDGLCRIYGKKDMPATGVAGGIERMMISMERAGVFPKLKETPEVFVVAVNDTVRRKCWNITQQLRREGLSADFDLKRRPLKKQLQYIDSTKIPYAVIVGQRELEKGTIKLKDMVQRSEMEVTLDKAIRVIRKI
jgi:histidyl-tRNA synthetase